MGSTGMYTGGRDINVHDEVPTAPAGGYLALFNQYLQKGHKQVEWTFSDGRNMEEKEKEKQDLVMVHGKKTTPVWYATVLVNEEVYGQGKGTTKQAAKNEAAKQGLDKMGIVVV